MSRDSTATFVHTHASHHADLFEEFCHPPSSNGFPASSSNNMNSANNASGSTGEHGMIHVPGHFLPFEEIHLPPHLMPLNPEDEDDVVPDMHAAFGIQSALGSQQRGGATGVDGEGSGRGAHQEPVWRDLGLDRLMDNHASKKSAGESTGGAKREGQKTSLLLMR